MGWASPECRDYINLLLTCRTTNTDLKTIVKKFDVVFHLPQTVVQETLKGLCNPKLRRELIAPSQVIVAFLLSDPMRRCDGSYPQGLASLGLA